MASTLKLTWPEGERLVTDGEPLTLGRDESCDVVIDNPNVSRRHAELRDVEGRWVLTDLGSSQGTFIAGAPVESVPIDDGSTAVCLGRPSVGVTLTVTTLNLAPPVVATSGAGLAAAEGTITGTSEPGSGARPGGALVDGDLVGPTVVTGDRLEISAAGSSYTFAPGDEYIIGRDPACDVPVSNPTVSRRHAALRHRDGNWFLDDLESSGGTFLDGKQMSSVALLGTIAVELGDPEIGEKVVAVSSGTRTRSASEKIDRATKSSKALIIVGCVAIVALLCGVAAFAVARQGGTTTNDTTLAKAAVYLFAHATDPTTGKESAWSGSGTIIDAKRGLILTNSHVASPQALGMGAVRDSVGPSLYPNPDSLQVGVSDGPDHNAEPKFKAKVIVSDGYLDLAVIAITETLSGAKVSDKDLKGLTAIKVGNSDDVHTGDAIRIAGYPGVAESEAPTITKGSIAGVTNDPRLESDRAWFNLDAQSRHGNSGGTLVDSHGLLVAVPTQGHGNAEGELISQARPINWAKPLIDAAVAGTSYTSRWVQPATGSEKLDNLHTVAAGNAGISPGCSDNADSYEPGATGVAFCFDYSGFAQDKHTDLRFDVVALDANGDPTKVIGSATTVTEYPFNFSSKGTATATVVFDDGAIFTSDGFGIVAYVGPNLKHLATFT